MIMTPISQSYLIITSPCLKKNISGPFCFTPFKRPKFPNFFLEQNGGGVKQVKSLGEVESFAIKLSRDWIFFSEILPFKKGIV